MSDLRHKEGLEQLGIKTGPEASQKPVRQVPPLELDDRIQLDRFAQMSSDRLNLLEAELKNHDFKGFSREHTKLRAVCEVSRDRFCLNARLNDLKATIARMEKNLEDLKNYQIMLSAQADRFEAVERRYNELA